MYCVWYGFGRAIIELLRTDSLMIGNIRVSCLLSLCICIAGAVLLSVNLRRAKENAKTGDYSTVFEENEEAAELTEETKEDENEQDN